MYCIYIYFILFYIMSNIHIVKRFRAHCGFYAIENKLLLLLLLAGVPVGGKLSVCLIWNCMKYRIIILIIIIKRLGEI